MRLAFLIPAADVTEPWRWAFDAEANALANAGVEVDPMVWTEAVDLSGYDLVLPLLVWGYHRRYEQWLRFLDRLEADRVPVENPAKVLRWSSDKAYLAELGRKGVATVPTIVADRLRPSDLEAAAESYGSTDLVIKPAVSAGADGAHRLRPSDNLPAALAGRRAMIQPFVASIADEGEYSLILFDGALSHSVIKRPRRGDFRVQPHLGGVTEPCAAPDGGEALAKAALAVAPAATSYARVDMIRGDDGQLQIMELELVEPALFLDLAPAAGAAFTRSILAAAERAGEQPLADGRGQVRRPAGIQPG